MVTPLSKLAFPESPASKEDRLRCLMRELGDVMVAFSGGVDSSYLAVIANQELGPRAQCVMGISPSVSQFQRQTARDIAERFGLNFRVIETDEFANPDYQANPTNRCYFCKTELYGRLRDLTAETLTVIFDGTNADDIGDYRPGRQAASENAVRSPLAELGFTKQDIRDLSRALELPTWDKPASPCLSSRVAYGVPVTIARLSKIEKGEDILRGLGFREFRVRSHGDLARIEIAPEELPRALNVEMSGLISTAFRPLGFKFVTLDLDGFRSGALNAQLIED